MNKKKMVVDIIGSEIKKHGFTYGLEKAYSAPNLWGFSREVNGIIQRITIQEHRYEKAFFLGFSTSAWGNTMNKRAGDEIKLSNTYRNKQDQWYYETDEDVKTIFTEFLDIIEKYGLKELERMSIEPEVIPTNEMGEKLISSYESLSRIFVEKNRIQDLHMTSENISKWFELIENKFEQTKSLPYNDVKDMLLETVAFLGEQLRQELQGKWVMGIEPRIILLENLRTRPFLGYFPLKSIVEAWDKNDISKFKEEYITFFRNKM